MSLALQTSYREPRVDSKLQDSRIPNEFLPESSKTMVESNVKHNFVTAVNANSQNAGGQFVFTLNNTSNEWLKSKSVCFSFSMTATTSGGSNPYFKSVTNSASGAIKMVSIYVNNVLVEQIDNYDKYKNILYTHATNSNYVIHDLNILEASRVTELGTIPDAPSSASFFASAGTSTLNISLNCGLFDSLKAVPLFLLNNVQIVIDLQTINNSFICTTATQTVSSVVYTNPKLFYTTIQMDRLYNETIKAILASGNLFSIQMNMIRSASSSRTASFTEQLGINYKSLNGTFIAPVINADLSSTDPAVATTFGHFRQNGMTSVDWMLDNVRYPTYQIDVTNEIPTTFMNLQAALGNLQDATITSLTRNANYSSCGFVVGVDLRRSKSSDYIHVGTPCQMLYSNVNGVTASASYFHFHSYSGELLIGGDGSIRVVF